jgi:hypothetical protein
LKILCNWNLSTAELNNLFYNLNNLLRIYLINSWIRNVLWTSYETEVTLR